ncbi:MAG: anthranilate phosphoribosyltransferase [Bacteroidota bacterium]
MKFFIEKLCNHEHLSHDEAQDVMRNIMEGKATNAQIASLLIALKFNGEIPEEIIGFVEVMLEKAVKIQIDDPEAIDMCGTGGDGSGTFNISTAASFVVAGAGITVAKHGNRSISSSCGSADVLKALGVNIELPPERVADCINKIGIGFLFAPMFHPAMKYAAQTRADLGVKTCFNILGPMTNPARVKRQLVGAFSDEAAATLAAGFSNLGSKKVCIVHSSDGLDEVSLGAQTRVYEITGGSSMETYTIQPDALQLPIVKPSEIIGGSSDVNAKILSNILKGERGPHRDVVLANAAFGLYVAGKAQNPREGVSLAVESIDSGSAQHKLHQLIMESNR